MKTIIEQPFMDQDRINNNLLYRAIRSSKNSYQINAANFILHQTEDFFRGESTDLRLNKKIQYICAIFNIRVEDTWGSFLMKGNYIHNDTFYEIEDVLNSTELVWSKYSSDEKLFDVAASESEEQVRIEQNPVLQKIASCKNIEKLNTIWFVIRAKSDFSYGQRQSLCIVRKIAFICGILGMTYEQSMGYWATAQEKGEKLRIVSVASRNEIVEELNNANKRLGIIN